MKRFLSVLLPLVLMTNWSVGLLLVRMFVFRSSYYDFLLWNAFLAWVPIAMTLILFAYMIEKKKKMKAAVLSFIILIWIIFLPNAPYLLTDFVHFRARGIVPLWFDIFLVLSFTLLGLFQFEYSIIQMREIIKKQFKKNFYYFVVPVSIVLVSVGVYAGRFLRWNSWEVVTNPLSLIRETLMVFTTPYLLANAVSYIVAMTVFLSLFHYLVHAVGKLSRME